MQAEVLTHLPHAESPRCIGCPNRVIPLCVLLRVPSHRPSAARPLAARHFTQVLAWLDLGNGSVNKGLIPQEHLRTDVVTQRWQPDAFAHEIPIPSLCCSSALGKGRQYPIGRQPFRSSIVAAGGAIATPPPVSCIADHASTHRIEHDVASHFEQVAVLVDKNRLVSSLEQMARQPMAPVVLLRVHAVELPHAFG